CSGAERTDEGAYARSQSAARGRANDPVLSVCSSGSANATVVVAVTVMLVMEMSRDEIVDVVAVRHRFVATVRSMLMCLVMARTLVPTRATVRVAGCDRDVLCCDHD